MPKIVFIGAGSGFGPRLCQDMLAHEALRASELCLVDVNETALAETARYVQEVIDHYHLPATVTATADRRSVLAGADYVVISVAIGGPAYNGVPYYHEIEIPKRYGILQEVADTTSIGAIFRTLRTAPEMLGMARDIMELCPQAWVLNYTNPMAMLCWLMTEAEPINLVGLCHSVQGTAHQIAGYIGVPVSEVRYWCAGINHMAWYLRYEHQGVDAYPRIKAAAEDPEVYAKDRVRFEILKHFDYFVTESSRHMSEYVPYFRKTAAQVESMGLSVRAPLPSATWGRHDWLEDIRKQLQERAPDAGLQSSGEYASYIIKALETGETFRFNGNVRNNGLIANLPADCCVEVPCFTDETGVHPCYVGALPSQLAALNESNINVHRLTVEACLERDKRKAYQAALVDPFTSSLCTLPQIQAMFEEMWTALTPWLAAY